eukprot:6196347-Karenia_brevis.AAC.1
MSGVLALKVLRGTCLNAAKKLCQQSSISQERISWLAACNGSVRLQSDLGIAVEAEINDKYTAGNIARQLDQMRSITERMNVLDRHFDA